MSGLRSGPTGVVWWDTKPEDPSMSPYDHVTVENWTVILTECGRYTIKPNQDLDVGYSAGAVIEYEEVDGAGRLIEDSRISLGIEPNPELFFAIGEALRRAAEEISPKPQ